MNSSNTKNTGTSTRNFQWIHTHYEFHKRRDSPNDRLSAYRYETILLRLAATGNVDGLIDVFNFNPIQIATKRARGGNAVPNERMQFD